MDISSVLRMVDIVVYFCKNMLWSSYKPQVVEGRTNAFQVTWLTYGREGGCPTSEDFSTKTFHAHFFDVDFHRLWSFSDPSENAKYKKSFFLAFKKRKESRADFFILSLPQNCESPAIKKVEGKAISRLVFVAMASSVLRFFVYQSIKMEALINNLICHWRTMSQRIQGAFQIRVARKRRWILDVWTILTIV